MSEVSIRDLRNHGGEVVDRVQAGEALTVTRSGRPVAALRPLRKPGIAAETLLARWSHLPRVDPLALRRDVDRVIDQTL